jgi:hypothetical protein
MPETSHGCGGRPDDGTTRLARGPLDQAAANGSQRFEWSAVGVQLVHRHAMTTAGWPYDDLDVAALLAEGRRPTPFQDVIVKVHQRCNLPCTSCYGSSPTLQRHQTPTGHAQHRAIRSIVGLTLGGASRSEQVGRSPTALLVVESGGTTEQGPYQHSKLNAATSHTGGPTPDPWADSCRVCTRSPA